MSSTFKLYKLMDNIHLEGTVSHFLIYLGPSFYFMSKIGKLFTIFSTQFSIFHKIKTRA